MASLSRASLALAALGLLRSAAGEEFDQCPGTLSIKGFGDVSLVAAAWNTPGVPAAPVEVDKGTVLPDMWGRAYFAEECTNGTYDYTKYTSMKLLGKKLTYTTDVSKSGCGCNTAMYLVSMPQNPDPSGCEDYYCDANSVCGPNCAEIDIQEANKYAWHSTLHKSYDGSGVTAGYGGSVHDDNHYDMGPTDYGPGSHCIDTNQPFEVTTSFPVGPDGKLREMRTTLSQKKQPCVVEMTIDSYAGDPGFDLLTLALADGMTPVISWWKSDDMLWLDGPGAGGGPCRVDDCACDAAPKFSDFILEDLEPAASTVLP